MAGGAGESGAAWEKAWKYAIQPLLALVVTTTCFYISSSLSSIRVKVDKQGETLADINGKVNYGVIQRIESLERSHEALQVRVTELERRSSGAQK